MPHLKNPKDIHWFNLPSYTKHIRKEQIELEKEIEEDEASSFSGSYNDLTDKPSIPSPQVNSDWDATSGKALILNKPSIPTTPQDIGAQPAGSYATTADLFSGDYADLTGAPTIPTNNNQLTNGAGYLTTVPAQTWSSITGKPTFSTVATSGDYADLSGTPTLFSGSYGDLTGTPTLGTAASANTEDFATSAQGDTADTAVQPGDLGNVATVTVPTVDPGVANTIWFDGTNLVVSEGV